jgi:DNA-binding Xre family transcriptional regulator
MIRLKIKEVAEAKGFNQSSLSRASDVSFNTVKRIFRDPYREITTTTLAKLAKALGVDPRELIDVVPDDEPPKAQEP